MTTDEEYSVGVRKPAYHHSDGQRKLRRRGRLYVAPAGQESRCPLYLRFACNGSKAKEGFTEEELLGVVADHIQRQYRPPEHWRVVRDPDVPLSREELENAWLRDRRTREEHIRPEERKRFEDFADAETQPSNGNNSKLRRVYKEVMAQGAYSSARKLRPTITYHDKKSSTDDLDETEHTLENICDSRTSEEPIDNSQRIGNLFDIDEDEVEDKARILVH